MTGEFTTTGYIVSAAFILLCFAGILYARYKAKSYGLQPGDVLCNTKDEED